MTSQEEKHIRALVNAYSRTADNDRYLDYGDDIEITDYTAYQITECRLESQLDRRDVVEHHRPYTGTHVPALTVTSPSQVDRWVYEPTTLAKGRFQDTTAHLTVPGSEHVQTCFVCHGVGKVDCPTCGAKGEYTCPDCGGSGTEECSSCGGSGRISVPCSSCGGKGGRNVVRTTQKQVPRYDYTSGKTIIRYEYVTESHNEWVSCGVCGGRKTIDKPCPNPSCHGGRVACKRCGGRKTVTCHTCGGNKKVICKICEGLEKLLHSLRVVQTLERRFNHQLYIRRDFWEDIKDMPWRRQCRTESVFEQVDTALQRDLYTSNDDYNDTFNGFIADHRKLTTNSCHIRFQRASVTRFHLHQVKYKYNDREYTGYILGNTFHPVNSPIIEYAGELIKGAESSLKRRSAIGARRKLKEAESLNVGGTNLDIRRLLNKVNAHLNVITKLGLKIMFWLVALFVTPFVFQYYDAFNPVLSFADFVNRPDWFGYNMLPVAQCLIFLYLLKMTKADSFETDYSELDYNHALMYFGVGMGKMVLGAVVIFAGLALANFLGLGIITATAMWLAWWVIKIVLFIIFIIIALIVTWVT